MLDFLIRTFCLCFSLSYIFLSLFVLIFVFIVLVDFNSNTNNKTTPFSSHLFSADSFLNYTKPTRRTSSPIDHFTHPRREQEDEDDADDEIEEDINNNNEEDIGTDENDGDLDEDSCNR